MGKKKAERKREALKAAPYTFTPAQRLMRDEMAQGLHRGSREPVKLGDALDELFVDLRRRVIEREAEQRYPVAEAKHTPVEEELQDAFIAGAEWWARYGV